MQILLFFKLCYGFIDYSSTTYPFPSDNFTSIYVPIDKPVKNCLFDLLSDGKCDLLNNNQNCEYDGGDCCRFTCEENCKAGCLYKCGSRGYHCIEDTKCSNCVNGKCKPMSECYNNSLSIQTGIENCLRNDSVHGNSYTADFYCGLDPSKTIIHDFDQITFHYPGCGLLPEICSAYQCCTDVVNNNVTADTCNNETRTATAYNLLTGRVESVFMSCESQFEQCFVNNSMISKGECCECDKG